MPQRQIRRRKDEVVRQIILQRAAVRELESDLQSAAQGAGEVKNALISLMRFLRIRIMELEANLAALSASERLTGNSNEDFT